MRGRRVGFVKSKWGRCSDTEAARYYIIDAEMGQAARGRRTPYPCVYPLGMVREKTRSVGTTIRRWWLTVFWRAADRTRTPNKTAGRFMRARARGNDYDDDDDDENDGRGCGACEAAARAGRAVPTCRYGSLVCVRWNADSRESSGTRQQPAG